jgi:hypothetical protein
MLFGVKSGPPTYQRTSKDIQIIFGQFYEDNVG